MRFNFFKLLLVGAAFAAGVSAHAAGATAAELQVGQAFARATVAGQTSGAVYLTIRNGGKNEDRLIRVISTAANSAEIHLMSMEGNVMKMREAGQLTIAPGAQIAMKPGDGYHIMLVGLHAPLKKGDKVPLTLVFEKAGKIELLAPVMGISASTTHHHH